jgi:hypothetical protein
MHAVSSCCFYSIQNDLFGAHDETAEEPTFSALIMFSSTALSCCTISVRLLKGTLTMSPPETAASVFFHATAEE